MAGPLLRKVRCLAAKIETTIGTAISLSGSDGVWNVYDPEIVPTVQMTERQGQGAFSKLTDVLGQQSGTCTFSTDLTLGTALPAWASTFLPACGLAVTSTTFGCKSEAPGTNVKTLTMAVYVNGVVRRIKGACGTFTAQFLAGEKITLNFTFTGVYDDFSATSILTPTYPNDKALRWASSTATYGGTAFAAKSLMFDLGNQVTLLESQATSTGFKNAIIADRTPTITLDPESDTSNTITRYGNWMAGTTGALSWTATGDGTWTFACPAAQIINQQPGERAGVEVENLTLKAVKSSALNDEFTMAYTVNT